MIFQRPPRGGGGTFCGPSAIEGSFRARDPRQPHAMRYIFSALATSYDSSLLWYVDIDASRHYSSISSDFIDLTPSDDLASSPA